MFKFDPKYIIDPDQYDQTRERNMFSYGHDRDNPKWLVKHTRVDDQKEFDQRMQDIVFRYNCSHPSIVPVTGYYTVILNMNQWDIYIKMPKMQKNLKDFILEQNSKENKYLSQEEVYKHFLTLIKGLEYLHKNRIAHRAIEPSNILIDEKGNMKLSDLSLSMVINEEEENEFVEDKNLGNKAYHAPEIRMNHDPIQKKILYKADIWSLGMVLGQICLSESELIKSISAKQKKDEIENILVNVENKYGPEISSILKSMLAFDHTQRKTLREILEELEIVYEQRFSERQNRTDLVSTILEERKESKISMDLSSYDHYNDLINVNASGLEKKPLSNNNLDKERERVEYDREQANKEFEELKKKFNVRIKDSVIVQSLEKNNIKDQDVHNLVRCLLGILKEQKKENVETFGMELSKCINVTEESLLVICKLVGEGLPHLKHIKLDFSECENVKSINTRNLTKITGQFFKQLTYFSLDLTKLKNIIRCELEEENVLEVASEIKRSIKSLGSIKVKFHWNQKARLEKPNCYTPSFIKISKICNE